MKNILSIIFILGAVYQLNAQCIGSGHSTHEADMWMSCQTSPNPNPTRGSSHWILYDLGYTYTFTNTILWNYNVTGETNQGIKCMTIDYSIDGVNWSQAGRFNLNQAPGTNDYQGVSRNDLMGKTARYVLFTVENTWNDDTCAGLSEVKFNVTQQLALHCGDDPDGSFYLNVYPNPATDYIQIDMDVRKENEGDFAKKNNENTSIILLNSTGHELRRMPAQSDTEYIDISGLPSGVYLLQVVGEGYQSCTRRFVKK